MIYSIGNEVQISSSNRYSNKYLNMFGIVQRISGSTYGIKITNKSNPSSQYGIFWFHENDIKRNNNIINNENNKENEKMIGNYKTAVVKFLDGTNSNSTYFYALYDDVAPFVSADDMVVVSTGHHGFSIAQIVEIRDEKSDKVTCDREVISKIDLTVYENRKNQRIKMNQIKTEMDKRVEQLKEESVYEIFAEKDPTLKELLQQFNSLKD